MFKVKFRVYVERLCFKCKTVHQHPTHRYIFYMGDGKVTEVVQNGHKYACSILNRDGNNLRPLFQYTYEVK